MQLKYKVVLLFFLTLNWNVFSQDVELNVLAPSYDGKDVYIWLEDDFFSGHKLLIDQQKLHDNSCTFIIPGDRIKKIRIGIAYQYASMFIEPGSSYTVSFPKHDSNNNRSLAWNTKVMLSYIDLKEDDINAEIMQFNSDLDDFFTELILTEENDNPTQDGDLTDSLQYPIEVPANFSQRESLAMFKEYKASWPTKDSTKSAFYQAYKKYAGASISYSLGERKDSLYNVYLNEQPILYENPEYALFFNDFYANYFDFYAFYPLSKKLDQAFASSDVKSALAKLIADDNQTGNADLQELVLLKGLYDYRANHPDKDSIITYIIEEIAQNSPVVENKRIAQHYLEKINKGKAGTAFPDMQYISYTVDTVYLSEMGGKMIYLQVFATWSSSSIAELELMDELYRKYQGQVQFISLSIDPGIDQFNLFVKENRKYGWEFGWIGVQPQTLEQLAIYGAPQFYLISDDFKILEWQALSPSTGAEKKFYEMELKRKEDSKFRFWENQSNKSRREE